MSVDVRPRVIEIEDYVASNELDAATRRLMDFVNDFGTDRKQRRQVINLRGLYSDIRENLRISGKTRKNDILSRELRNQILEMVDDIAANLDNNAIHPSITQSETDNPTQSSPRQTLPPSTESLKQNQSQESNIQFVGNEVKQETPRSQLTACECIRISRIFRHGSIDFTLHPISLKLKLGEITAVVGENGSGKTTLLRIIAGVIRYTKGSLFYRLIPMQDVQDPYLIKQHLAYIPQELPRWPGSIKENLLYSAGIHGLRGEKNEQEVEFIIRRLGLEKYKDARWHEISSGFKTRFSLAKALLRHSQILVLDEPLANLDINTQTIFLQDLRNLTNSVANPMAIIISSQHLHEVENIADNILFLRDGQALYNGPMALFGEDRTENSFELSCNLSKEELLNAINDLAYLRVEPEGNDFIIHTSKNVNASMLLKTLLSKDVKVRFFRDISRSTRKLFSENYEQAY